MEQNTTSKRAHAFSLSRTLRRLWRRFPEAAVVAALLIVVNLFGQNILTVSLKVNEQWIAVSGLVTGLLAAAVKRPNLSYDRIKVGRIGLRCGGIRVERYQRHFHSIRKHG